MEKIRAKLANPLFVVFFTVFIDLIGFGILIPVIPQLITNPISTFYLFDKATEIKDGLILLGFLTAIYPFMQFIATPILGQLSDKFGRKKILIISLAGTCISYVIFAIGIMTRNLPLLFISRAFDGITGGNIAVAFAAIADISTPENRTKNFGLIGAAFGLGFVLGPYIGGKLSDSSIMSWFNATTPFWFAAILCFLNILSVIFIFPETNKHIDNLKKINWSKSIKNIIDAVNIKAVRPIFTTSFFFNGGFTFFQTFAGVFFITRFNWNQGNIGDYFAYVGIWIAIAQAIVTRKVSDLLREDQILKFSMFGTAAGLLLIFLSNQWWNLLFITPLFAIFIGLTMAATNGLISRSVDAKIQGEVLGISSSVQALAQSIPAVLSGYLAAAFTAEAPIIVAAVIIAFAGTIFWVMYRRPANMDQNKGEAVMAH